VLVRRESRYIVWNERVKEGTCQFWHSNCPAIQYQYPLPAKTSYTALMRFILVDTADARGCVALCQDAVPIAVEAHPADQDHSSWLLPAVRRLLDSSRLSLSELDGYAVCSGPGSFTGLRVGLTTVKAWAEIYAKPIVAVSRLAAFAQSKPSSRCANAEYVAAYLDAHRSQVFAALYRNTGAVLNDESVIALEAFVEMVQAVCGSTAVRWKTPDLQLLQKIWPRRQAHGDLVEPIEPPFSSPLAALAHTKFLQRDFTDSLALDANYVRRSDAEILWKGNPSAARI
jgi:tRNA threonylcarbamoyladenosine biosynthesis protein TsaB